MRKLLLLLALLLAPCAASAQCTGIFPAQTACGSAAGGVPGPLPLSAFTGNVVSIGATCDGSADNTTVIANAIAAAPASGAIWQLPAGVCNVTSFTINKPGIFRGTGMGQGGSTDSSTIIQGTSANSNVITLAADGIWLRDLSVTSSVSAGSRTGAGVKATVNGASVENVSSFGHQYGFWNQSQGAYYNRVYGSQNNSHGMFLDSTVAQNEVRIYNSEFDNNTGDGIHLSGTNQGAGARLAYITATANANAIYATNYGDLWIINPELSINTTAGITLTNAGGSLNQVSIVAPFVESTSAGDNIKISGATAVNIVGGSSWAASGYGVNADTGSDIIIAGMVLQSNGVSGLRINNVPNSTFSANNFSNTAATGLTQSGITWGTSAVPVTMAGNDLSASDMSTKESGTRPAGASVVGNLGIPNTIGASTMFGAIAMGSNNITGGGTATFSSFVGTLTGGASLDLPLAGGTMSGGIAMGGNGLTGASVLGTSTYIISGLPTCNSGSVGQRAYVTNGATSPTFLGTVSSTGAVTAPVFCNGTAWVYG